MELTGFERHLLAQLLPDGKNYATMRILHDLRMALSFTEEEYEALGLDPNAKAVNGAMLMNHVGDVQMGNTAIKIIKSVLRKLDEDEQVKNPHVPLFPKFFSEEECEAMANAKVDTGTE